MNIEQEIAYYISGQPKEKSNDMQILHDHIIAAHPGCKLWFLDGKNSDNKVIANPNIGYGVYTMRLAGGKTREFYRVGLSGNTTGISVYIMGIDDKKYLAHTYGKTLGKASVTGYCIKFKSLKDVNLDVLMEAISLGFVHQ